MEKEVLFVEVQADRPYRQNGIVAESLSDQEQIIPTSGSVRTCHEKPVSHAIRNEVKRLPAPSATV